MTPKTIAWIEDDTDIIDAVIRPLENAKHKIIRLRTKSDALRAVEQLRAADLILLDIFIPVGGSAMDNAGNGEANGSPLDRYTGKDLLATLRGPEFNVQTPVVIFSVIRRPEVVKALNEMSNVLAIVPKPSLPSVLKERVEEALRSIEERTERS